jgi:hypothetical protein
VKAHLEAAAKNKSLFASFSSEKEESCSFLKKRTKRLLPSAPVRRYGTWPAKCDADAGFCGRGEG